MGIIDILIIIVITVAFVKGFSNGFIVELGHIVGIILGLYLALTFASVTLETLNIKGDYKYEIAFAITLVVVIVSVALLGKILTRFIDIINLSIINRLLGGAVNIVTTILVLALLLEILESFNGKAHWFKNSVFDTLICTTLLDVADAIFPYLEKYIGSSKGIVNDIINV